MQFAVYGGCCRLLARQQASSNVGSYVGYPLAL